jgi:hypothetical protein
MNQDDQDVGPMYQDPSDSQNIFNNSQINKSPSP